MVIFFNKMLMDISLILLLKSKINNHEMTIISYNLIPSLR